MTPIIFRLGAKAVKVILKIAKCCVKLTIGQKQSIENTTEQNPANRRA
jgi:hypothetical protein